MGLWVQGFGFRIPGPPNLEVVAVVASWLQLALSLRKALGSVGPAVLKEASYTNRALKSNPKCFGTVATCSPGSIHRRET